MCWLCSVAIKKKHDNKNMKIIFKKASSHGEPFCFIRMECRKCLARSHLYRSFMLFIVSGCLWKHLEIASLDPVASISSSNTRHCRRLAISQTAFSRKI